METVSNVLEDKLGYDEIVDIIHSCIRPSVPLFPRDISSVIALYVRADRRDYVTAEKLGIVEDVATSSTIFAAEHGCLYATGKFRFKRDNDGPPYYGTINIFRIALNCVSRPEYSRESILAKRNVISRTLCKLRRSCVTERIGTLSDIIVYRYYHADGVLVVKRRGGKKMLLYVDDDGICRMVKRQHGVAKRGKATKCKCGHKYLLPVCQGCCLDDELIMHLWGVDRPLKNRYRWSSTDTRFVQVGPTRMLIISSEYYDHDKKAWADLNPDGEITVTSLFDLAIDKKSVHYYDYTERSRNNHANIWTYQCGGTYNLFKFDTSNIVVSHITNGKPSMIVNLVCDSHTQIVAEKKAPVFYEIEFRKYADKDRWKWATYVVRYCIESKIRFT